MADLARAALYLSHMKLNQWKSGEELRELQEAKLGELIKHSSATVPHYRKSLKGKRIRSLEDLPSLPMTRKSQVRDSPSFVSSSFPEDALYKGYTSGSTGIPLTVYYNDYENCYASALRWHFFLENGVGPFDVQAFITYRGHSPGPLQRLGLFRRHHLSYLDPDAKNLRLLGSLKATVLTSFPSLLVPLAMRNLASESPVRIGKAFSCSEVVTKEARSLVEKSFCCSLSDRYGSVETGTIAWECGKGSMHICSDSAIVEIVDEHGNPEKPGEAGNVLVTPLWRRSMPFIRYKIGDRAAIGGRCRCGRGLPVLKSLEGQSNDFLLLPSGRLYLATSIGINLRYLPNILQYQTVQETRERLCVKLVLAEKSRFDEAAIISAVKSALPERMDVELELVERINNGGKRKLCDFVSKLKNRGPEFNRI